MKKEKTVKSSKKLVLNKETIRELRSVDLERLGGGYEDIDPETGDPGSAAAPGLGAYCC